MKYFEWDMRMFFAMNDRGTERTKCKQGIWKIIAQVMAIKIFFYSFTKKKATILIFSYDTNFTIIYWTGGKIPKSLLAVNLS